MAAACRELGYIELKRARYERADAWLARSEAVAPDRDSRTAAAAIHGVVASDRGRTGQAIEQLTSAAGTRARWTSLDSKRGPWPSWAEATSYGRSGSQLDWRSPRGLRSPGAQGGPPSSRSRSPCWQRSIWPRHRSTRPPRPSRPPSHSAARSETRVGREWPLAGSASYTPLNGRIDEAIAWLDDARTRCMRIADSYLWVQAYCLDALCGVAVKHTKPEARAWVADLETLAARTGMSELLVRAHLHRAALGDRSAAETASLFADRIDNPAVLQGISRAAS